MQKVDLITLRRVISGIAIISTYPTYLINHEQAKFLHNLVALPGHSRDGVPFLGLYHRLIVSS